MRGINILGTGSFVPERIITNDDMSKIVDTNDEWITTRTGIKQRHISEGEPTWYIATQAARKALESSGIKAEDIDLIICSTVTPDFFCPSIACMVQREIGAIGCMAMDISCACAGFVYLLDMARRYLLTGDVKKVLVISAETLSNITDYTDRATCILFGDGAAAAVIEASDKMYASFLGADGNGGKYLVARHHHAKNVFGHSSDEYPDGLPESDKCCIVQDGKEVYKFATKILPFACLNALEKANLTIDDIELFIPHQANQRIIETAAKNIGVPMDKFFITLDKYGNTSSSSIPIAFNEAVEIGRVKRGDKICFVGFGAGLTYGSVIIEY